MTTISILNDKITTLFVNFQNPTGGSATAPSGDSYTAVSSAPASLSAAIGGTSTFPTLVLTPMVQAGTGYTVTVSDTKGLTPATISVSITPDPALAALAAQLVIGATSSLASQPVPTNPGP